MTTVRCKFRCESITITKQGRWREVQGEDQYVEEEAHTISMTPVYGGGDPDHENTKFWEATPSGRLELQCVHRDAVKHIRPGDEFYVDLIPAEKG